MKARLVPVYFVQGRDQDFDLQLDRRTSRHYLLMTGHWQDDIAMLGKIFDFEVAQL